VWLVLVPTGLVDAQETRTDAEEDGVGLPPSAKIDRAQEKLSEQRGRLGTTYQLLRAAKNSRDVIQVNCLSDKVAQMRALLKVSEQASVGLLEAISRGDQLAEQNFYARINIAEGRSKAISAEARQCVGAKAVYTGQTNIEVTRPDDAPSAEATGIVVPTAGPGVPPVASVF
jgi:hypothetical protein